MDKPRLPWYRMDNASVMYSSLQKEEYSAIYRFSAMMSAPVEPEALQSAIDRVMPRFPGFAVRIKKGLFWYYFEPNTAPGPFLKKDVAEPCRPVRFNEDNNWLVRFYYYGSRISVEVFHALADGYGALTFFRTLLAEYLRRRGADIPAGNGVLDLDEPPRREEWEDAYSRYAANRTRPQPLMKRAYLNVGTSEPFYTFNVTMGFVPVDRLKEQAKKAGVSVSEYLSAVLTLVLIEKQKEERPFRERPVALAVPVNLRAFFPTETLRNFILTVQPWIDPAIGPYSFEEIAALIHHYMRIHCAPQELRAAFSRNVRFQNNGFLKFIPRVLKNPIMAVSYRTKGLTPYSATMTNPGVFNVPDEMRGYILHMEAIQGQATVPRAHLACMSYGNTMTITFSGTQIETGVERDFFRFLVKSGVPVHIESNRHRPDIATDEEEENR
ncbi:MAG: hypothetical protein VB039_00445 [Oscillospiraceae bacterium]|nr:hypothetical protein [Oscillospiraceae bacterium]